MSRDERGYIEPPTSWPRPATPARLEPHWAGEFKDFHDWVSFASQRLTGVTGSVGEEVRAICVDAIGRRCQVGADFTRAREQGTFPVRYFWDMRPVADPEGFDVPDDFTGSVWRHKGNQKLYLVEGLTYDTNSDRERVIYSPLYVCEHRFFVRDMTGEKGFLSRFERVVPKVPKYSLDDYEDEVEK